MTGYPQAADSPQHQDLLRADRDKGGGAGAFAKVVARGAQGFGLDRADGVEESLFFNSKRLVEFLPRQQIRAAVPLLGGNERCEVLQGGVQERGFGGRQALDVERLNA